MSTFPVGAKLFFPNVTMKLMRSPLPPHQAVFRCAPSLNKADIKEYLTKLYGLEITDIRTMNYASKRTADKRKSSSSTNSRIGGFGAGAYKKVIVTMKDDFVFPPLPDMSSQTDSALRLMDGVSRLDPKKMKDMIRRMAAERNIDLARKKVLGESDAPPVQE